MHTQPGFFDLLRHTQKLTQIGDPLVALKANIDWEAFRADLNSVHAGPKKSKAGAKPFDVVLKFKILVLQQLHNLSDDRIEFAIRDRLSFMRFLGLQVEDRVPDAKTIWVFREQIKRLELIDTLFARFHEQLAGQGFVARAGQMIDATFIEIPRQRNTREENAQIKAGTTPAAWQHDTPEAAHKRAQKQVDARWTKKNQETHYGYKNHVNADEAHKLVQSWDITHAAVHDSNVFETLLDQQPDGSGKKRDVYADSAYRSEDKQTWLSAQEIGSQVCEKGVRNHPLSEEQKAANHVKSKVRVRVEHVFAAQAQMGGHVVRVIGMARAKVKVGMMNLVYNMVRLGQLLRRKISASSTVAPATS